MFTYFFSCYIMLSKFIRFPIHSIHTNNRMNFIANFNRKREDSVMRSKQLFRIFRKI